MRRLILVLVAGLVISLPSVAQNNQGKSDDAARLSLAVEVDADDMPMVSQTELKNRISRICNLNGLGNENTNPLFSIKATVDVVSKELTATAPPMHSLVLTVNMYVVDNGTGNIFSQTSIDLKGSGQNETKAYNSAIRGLDSKKGQFKSFVEQGKSKILAYYNSQCDIVISKAQALWEQGLDDEARDLLLSVPSVCKDCYMQCMQLVNDMKTVAPATQPANKQD